MLVATVTAPWTPGSAGESVTFKAGLNGWLAQVAAVPARTTTAAVRTSRPAAFARPRPIWFVSGIDYSALEATMVGDESPTIALSRCDPNRYLMDLLVILTLLPGMLSSSSGLG